MNKSIKKQDSIEDRHKIEEELRGSSTEYDPSIVLKRAKEEIEGKKETAYAIEPKSNTFKAMTLYEFDKGLLMLTTIADQYKTFAIDHSRKLQKEFNCETVAEKSLCEITTVNFIRSLEIQRKINNLFSQNGLSKLDVEYFTQLSKELDRAQRHYISSLQTLRSFKQPTFKLSVKADTAVVGQNQIIQTNKA